LAEFIKKILVVEDNPSIMKAERFALEEAGFSLDMATSGAEALDYLSQNDYGVILLDLVLPKGTGFDVMHDLRLHGSKIPVLVFSNMDDEISREEVLRLGAKDYYNKNKIGLDELVNKVRKFAV